MLTVAPTVWVPMVAPATSKPERTGSAILLTLSHPPGTIAINSSPPNLPMMSSTRVLARHHLPENAQYTVANGMTKAVID